MGTGFGVGTAWLHAGLGENGRLVTVGRDGSRSAAAVDLFKSDRRVQVLTGDWLLLQAHAPFDVFFCDGGGKRDDPQAVVEMLAPGVVLVFDDFAPQSHWPPLFDACLTLCACSYLTAPTTTRCGGHDGWRPGRCARQPTWEHSAMTYVADHDPSAGSPGDVTLASYSAAAGLYIEQSEPPGDALMAYLDRVGNLVGRGTVLELGSGPGWDAAYLESRGPRVIRTDAVSAFVEALRGDGHEARRLDVRVDDFGGPYDAVLADAVLLHLSREEFVEVLRRARHAVVNCGLLAFTLKEGDGEAWSRAKLGVPRHFTYWREPAVRTALRATGWQLLSLSHVAGRVEPWLFVIARASDDLDL